MANASVPVASVGGAHLHAPIGNIGVGNLVGTWKLSEKTIELTTCAQFGANFGVPMVWFGLTQAQEREYGFDAATELGGTAFILQFKASATVVSQGNYAGTRKFWCQHHQMKTLVDAFGSQRHRCFYFLPDFGTMDELTSIHGDVLSNAYLLDVADIARPVQPPTRKSGYHYVHLNTALPQVTICSEPKNAKVMRAKNLQTALPAEAFPPVKDLLKIARKVEQKSRRKEALFYRNAALVVIPPA